MKRFKVIDPTYRGETTRHETIEQVINELTSNRDMSLNKYYVECIIDDIEIEADELIKAWEEGERPEDLQMF